MHSTSLDQLPLLLHWSIHQGTSAGHRQQRTLPETGNALLATIVAEKQTREGVLKVLIAYQGLAMKRRQHQVGYHGANQAGDGRAAQATRGAQALTDDAIGGVPLAIL